MKQRIDPTIATLCNSYRNLASLWYARADSLIDSTSRDVHAIHDAVKEARACESKARQLEIRHSTLEFFS